MILQAMGKGGGGGALYPEFIGRRGVFVGSGAGPTSAATADAVSVAVPNYYIDSVLGGASTDGNYYVVGFPNGVGPRATWSLLYYNTSGTRQTGNLSGSTFVVTTMVGQF
jgi:hypothetical protein